MSTPAGAAPLTRRGIPVDDTLRVLAVSTFVNRAGAGAVTTTFALYFTRVVGIEPTQVGLALSAAALAGMVCQVPFGHLADTRGPREVTRLLTALTGVVSFGLLVTRNPWVLALVLAATSVFQMGSGAARSGYVARAATGGRGVAFKAYLRAVTNVAMAFGALLGGVALAIDRPWAYLAVFAIDALTTLAAAAVLGRLPHLTPVPPRAAGEPRLAVLRDLPYVVVTLLTGVMAMHFIVMEVGIPLWISEHTSAPTSLVAVLLVLNTVVVALFQVRLARGAEDVSSSSRAMLRGGVWIAVAFVAIGFTDRASGWVAAVVLVAAAAIHVVGEMVSSGGQWGVQMGLAPMERQGQYQGFAGMGFSLSNIVAPTLITLLCIQWGRPGWFVMGALVLGSAAAVGPASRWALRTRQRYGVLTHSG